jgi:hypothetical protein
MGRRKGIARGLHTGATLCWSVVINVSHPHPTSLERSSASPFPDWRPCGDAVLGVEEASAESKSGESLTAAFWTVGLELRVHTNGFHSPRKAEVFLLVG